MADLRELAQRLKSPDPKIRKQAIIDITNTQDPKALKALQWVYKNDPEPALQDLALRGAKFIKEKQAQAQPAHVADDYIPPWEQPAATPNPTGAAAAMPTQMEAPISEKVAAILPVDTFSSEPAPLNPTVAPQEVSDKDRRAAKALIDKALDLKIKGDIHKATAATIEAFALNPNLRFDMLATGLAADLLQLPSDKAVAMMLDRASRENLTRAVDNAVKQETKVRGEDEVEDFYNGIFWGVIYFLLWFLAIAGTLLIVVALIVAAANDESTLQTADPETVAELQELEEVVSEVGVPVALLVGGIVGAYQTFLLLFSAFFTNVAAKAMLGRGTMWGFFAKSVQYWLLIVISFFLILFSFATPLAFFGALLLCFSIPIMFYTYVRVIANYYELGMGVSFVVAIIGLFLYNVGTGLIPYVVNGLLSVFG